MQIVFQFFAPEPFPKRNHSVLLLAPRNPMVKAIRHGVAFSADPAIFTPPQVTEDLAYDTKFREGLALLKQYGFVYETWNYHEQCLGFRRDRVDAESCDVSVARRTAMIWTGHHLFFLSTCLLG